MPTGTTSSTTCSPARSPSRKSCRAAGPRPSRSIPNYYQFTTQSGLNETGLNFGNFINAENLSGMVYNDLNGDGSNDGGTDPGLAGWTINVLDSSNNVVATTTSDASGDYSFTALPVQPYTIEEVVQAGWIITQPTNPPGTYTVPGSSGDYTGPRLRQLPARERFRQRLQRLERQRQPGSGRSGPRRAGPSTSSTPAATWWPRPSATPAGTTRFPMSAPARSPLSRSCRAAGSMTQPVNPSYYSFTSSSGVNVVGGIFGNFHTITVSGNVYNDLDGNGLRSAGEPGLAGWTVDLEDSQRQRAGNGAHRLPTATTRSPAWVPARYQVAEVVQTNWVQTQPLYPTVYSFTTQERPEPDRSDLRRPRLTGLEPGRRDRQRPARLLRDRLLEHGGRRVQRHQPRRPDHAPAAARRPRPRGLHRLGLSFVRRLRHLRRQERLLDGGTVHGVRRRHEPGHAEHQRVDPGDPEPGRSDPGQLRRSRLAGAGNVYAISSGTLKVVLSNLASGNFVDADGVLLVAHDGPRRTLSAGSSPSSGNMSIGTVPAAHARARARRPARRRSRSRA